MPAPTTTIHGIRPVRLPYRRPLAACLAVTAACSAHAAGVVGVGDLANLSIEQLAQIQVYSASRYAENRFDAAAAIQVITRDEILRSGATSVPEALRLAPGVEVARVNAHQWQITIHGFNNNLSNKLLVLIDGRSVYSPLFAGVFWDAQDVPLEDIDRIEVILGPGGTLWGANAVNGVINIITRSAQKTQGGYARVGTGDEERAYGSVRYGGRLADNLAGRGYFRYFNWGPSRLSGGGDALDDWHMHQGGFRLDTTRPGADSYSLEGDAYAGREAMLARGDFTLGVPPGPAAPDHLDLGGANLRGSWRRQLDNGADFRVRAYWDHTRRDIPGTYNERRNTYDIEAKHFLPALGRHRLVWGAEYRYTADELDNTAFATFVPSSRHDQTESAFVQDKIDLWRRKLFLTLGSKFEHNDYSGFETQPNGRLTWLISERQTLWTAVSRVVRIPSRLESDLVLTSPVAVPSSAIPVFVQVRGSHDFTSEKLIAYEGGYRLQARENLAFDLSTFYNRYDDLMTTAATGAPVQINTPQPYLFIPAAVINGMRGKAYGGTLDVDWRPLRPWRLQFQASYFQMSLENLPGTPATNDISLSGNSPRHQAALHSFLDLTRDLSLYTGLRFVDKLPSLKVPRYTAVDASLLWHATPHVDLALIGRDLADESHPEFAGGNEIERSVFASVTWRD